MLAKGAPGGDGELDPIRAVLDLFMGLTWHVVSNGYHERLLPHNIEMRHCDSNSVSVKIVSQTLVDETEQTEY